MFLTDDEIMQLTGYKAPKSQIKWLTQNGIKYLIGNGGKPRVLIKVIESAMGLSLAPRKKITPPNELGLKRHLGLV